MTSRRISLCLLAFFLLGLGAAESFAQVDWERTSRSVVKIYKIDLWTGGEIEARTQEGVAFNVPVAVPRMGHGTGAILTEDCLVVTNAHIVEGALVLAVKVEDSEQVFPARLVAVYGADDVAFLLVDAPFCRERVLSLASDPSRVLVRGEEIVVLGYPLDAAAPRASLTRGAFSRYADMPRIGRLIQTDAAINPGNSGGPAFDKDGNFLGISVARTAEAEGINYILPAERVLRYLPELADGPARAEAAAKLRSIREELYDLLAQIAVDMIEKGAVTTREGLGAIQAIFSPWMERLDLFPMFEGDPLMPETNLMVGGVFWNLGIASHLHRDARRSRHFLGQGAQLIANAIAERPALRANSFVQAVMTFRDPRLEQEAPGSGATRGKKTPRGQNLAGAEFWPEFEYAFGGLFPSQVPGYVSRTQPLSFAAGLNFGLFRFRWFSTGAGLRLDYTGLLLKDPDGDLRLSVIHVVSPELVWQGRAKVAKRTELFLEPSLMLSAAQEEIDGAYHFRPGANIQVGVLLMDWLRISTGVKILSILGDTTAMPALGIGIQPRILTKQGRRARGR